jgi:CDP-diacylglycerol--glycerol-3-phosphate 3-phosphatidyltransferase
MISIYQLKPKFQNLLRPFVRYLAGKGITANQITVFAFLLSLLVGFFVYFFAGENILTYLVLPVFLFIRMALNAFDGMLAREHNQETRLGAVLNELGDILSDLVLYVAFLYVRAVDFWLILLFSLLVVLTETAGIMGVQIKASRRYDGPMGKSDRAFWLGFLALLSAFGLPGIKVLNGAVIIILILLALTVFNRLKNALKETL